MRLRTHDVTVVTKVTDGIEPSFQDLQSRTLPLCYVTVCNMSEIAYVATRCVAHAERMQFRSNPCMCNFGTKCQYIAGDRDSDRSCKIQCET